MIFYRREQSEVMVFLFKVWFYGFLLEKLITEHNHDFHRISKSFAIFRN